MKDLTKWERKDLGGAVPASRAKATEETNKDLQKPIQQLICDVHEEVGSQGTAGTGVSLNHAIKRQTSMMGRVALEQQESNEIVVKLTQALVRLTWVLVGLTLAILILTIVTLATP